LWGMGLRGKVKGPRGEKDEKRGGGISTTKKKWGKKITAGAARNNKGAKRRCNGKIDKRGKKRRTKMRSRKEVGRE